MRVVSLLPSATEIVCGLGLRDQLVGVTHECDYPSGVSDLPSVTRTQIPHDASSRDIDTMVREQQQTQQALYSLDIPLLESLRPDLIVTQALCDVCAVAESEVQSAVCSLAGKTSVINLEPTCLSDVFDGIRQVGDAAGCGRTAENYIDGLRHRVDEVVRRSTSIQKRPRVMLLEWIDPPFCAGHWSPELVEFAGGREIIGIAGQRSVTTTWDQIVLADPEVLVIACCGFSVERTLQDLPVLSSYPGWDALSCVTSKRVFVVDGSAYFSRPGPRLVDSLEILANVLHPDVHPIPSNLAPAKHVE